jgi:hypothetical protein
LLKDLQELTLIPTSQDDATVVPDTANTLIFSVPFIYKKSPPRLAGEVFRNGVILRGAGGEIPPVYSPALDLSEFALEFKV